MYCKNEPVILAASVDHLKTRFDIDVPEHNKKEAKLERALKSKRFAYITFFLTVILSHDA